MQKLSFSCLKKLSIGIHKFAICIVKNTNRPTTECTLNYNLSLKDFLGLQHRFYLRKSCFTMIFTSILPPTSLQFPRVYIFIPNACFPNYTNPDKLISQTSISWMIGIEFFRLSIHSRRVYPGSNALRGFGIIIFGKSTWLGLVHSG